jgi:rubrerythrin
MFKIHEIIDLAIMLEKYAEGVYRTRASRMETPGLQSLLTWMADEERNHRVWFEKLKAQIPVSEDEMLIREISGELLKDVVGKASLSLEDVDFSKMTSLGEMISAFLTFEQDTILFYELIQSFISDAETIEQLNRIIREETRHIEQLKEINVLHQTGKEQHDPKHLK